MYACMYVYTYVSIYGTFCPPMTCMASRSAFRSGLVIFCCFLGRFCLVLSWALSWKLEIPFSLLLVVAGFGRFFSLSRAGWFSKPFLKVWFLLFFVSFLFVLVVLSVLGFRPGLCKLVFLFLRYSKSLGL